ALAASPARPRARRRRAPDRSASPRRDQAHRARPHPRTLGPHRRVERSEGGTGMTEQFDLIVIGAGSAARDGAGKAKREHDANVAMVERTRWGGSCPNVACRPTKAYLTAAELVHDVNYEAANRGIRVSKAEVDLARVSAWKNSIRRDQDSWAEVLSDAYT